MTTAIRSTKRQSEGRSSIALASARVSRHLSRRLPYYLTPEEAHQIIEAARITRDRLFFQLLWETGVRVSEAIALRLCDVGRTGIRVRGPAHRAASRAAKLPGTGVRPRYGGSGLGHRDGGWPELLGPGGPAPQSELGRDAARGSIGISAVGALVGHLSRRGPIFRRLQLRIFRGRPPRCSGPPPSGELTSHPRSAGKGCTAVHSGLGNQQLGYPCRVHRVIRRAAPFKRALWQVRAILDRPALASYRPDGLGFLNPPQPRRAAAGALHG